MTAFNDKSSPDFKDASGNDERALLNELSTPSYDVDKALKFIGTADLEAREAHGNTPLHLAAYRELFDVEQAIIAAGARLDARNGQGHTPINIICMRKDSSDYVARLESLVDNSTDPDAVTRYRSKDGFNNSMAGAALVAGEYGVAIAALKKGVDPHYKNNNSKTLRDLLKESRLPPAQRAAVAAALENAIADRMPSVSSGSALKK